MAEKSLLSLKPKQRKKFIIFSFILGLFLVPLDIYGQFYSSLYVLIVLLCAMIIGYIKNSSL